MFQLPKFNSASLHNLYLFFPARRSAFHAGGCQTVQLINQLIDLPDRCIDLALNDLFFVIGLRRGELLVQ